MGNTASVKNKKPQLPRGLHWKSDSPFIWFSWRDTRGKQHRQSTGTDDPVKAFAFRAQFMEKRTENIEQVKSPSVQMGKLPLSIVADTYFNWKTANSSAATIARERRIFRPVEKFFGSRFPVNAIGLHHIRDYQRERRKQISPTMRQPVTARSVNYEMRLLRSAMKYAGCWSGELNTGYQPLREIKRPGTGCNDSAIHGDLPIFVGHRCGDYRFDLLLARHFTRPAPQRRSQESSA